MLSKPSEESFQPRLLQRVAVAVLAGQVDDHLQAVCAQVALPRASAASMALPAGLSVMENTSMRGLSPSARAWLNTCGPARSVMTPRLCDELSSHEEPVGLLQEMMKGGLAPDIGHELLTGCRRRLLIWLPRTWKIGRK